MEFPRRCPDHLLGRFNGFAKSVILRVNEARDLGDRINRFTFYDHTKIYAAAPPDVLRVDEKHLREYYVFNVLGFFDHQPQDRRHLPAGGRSTALRGLVHLTKEDFTPDYWRRSGAGTAAAALSMSPPISASSISAFDPKTPPPQTPACWDIVNTSQAPEDAELADVIDALDNPDVMTLASIAAANGGIAEWLLDRRNRRALPHRLERCDYVSVRNPYAKDGLWKLKGARQVIYAKATLSPKDREAAAQRLYQSGQ